MVAQAAIPPAQGLHRRRVPRDFYKGQNDSKSRTLCGEGRHSIQIKENSLWNFQELGVVRGGFQFL